MLFSHCVVFTHTKVQSAARFRLLTIRACLLAIRARLLAIRARLFTIRAHSGEPATVAGLCFVFVLFLSCNITILSSVDIILFAALVGFFIFVFECYFRSEMTGEVGEQSFFCLFKSRYGC